MSVSTINTAPVSTNTTTNTFSPSIPVVDISKFENVATRKQFLEELEAALKVGFFGVVNSGINVDIIQRGYDAFYSFFSQPREEKMKIYKKELHGQRGFTPGERAQGQTTWDTKEFLHISREGNIWPEPNHLEGAAMALYHELDRVKDPLLEAIALILGQRGDFFTSMTHHCQNNLMRALHYPKMNPQDGLWGGPHTDINLITLLPYASARGLQVKLNGEWVDVAVPKDALVVNVADMLEHFSNGLFPSCEHQVKCTEQGVERESVVYFVHPTDDTVVKPFVPSDKYPTGTRLQMLQARLVAIGLIPPDQASEISKSSFIQEMEQLVKAGTAAESVKKWYAGFQKAISGASSSTYN